MPPDDISDRMQDIEGAEADNVDFLRTPAGSPLPASSSTHSGPEGGRRQRLLEGTDRGDQTAPFLVGTAAPPEPQATAHDENADAHHDPRQRMQRVMARLSRRHHSVASYSDRIPPPRQQSLYDWAPRQQSNPDQEMREDDQGLEEILSALRRQHPSTHSGLLETIGRRQLQRQRDSEDEARARRRSQQQPRPEITSGERRNESLRSAAILQHARTSVRSPSGTERMLRYFRNRERTANRGEIEREDQQQQQQADEPATAPSPPPSTNYASNNPGLGSRYELNRLTWQAQQPSFQHARTPDVEPSRADADTRARVDAYRRGYLAENPAPNRASPSSSPSSLLENAVKYLDRLRATSSSSSSSSSDEDSLATAVDHGLALNDVFAHRSEDFITTTSHRFVPAPSSLLSPGAVFEGSQNTSFMKDAEHASQASSRLGSSIYTHDLPRAFDATRPWLSQNSAAPVTTFANARNNGAESAHKAFQDRWPVKVIIQAVDHQKMTMAGIMEAYDVPMNTLSSSMIGMTVSHAAPVFHPSVPLKRAFPITTYLEGQMIDFSTHSFLTPAPTSTFAPAQSEASQSAHPSRVRLQDISFPPTSAVTDAANWRNLPPFDAMKSDEEVARAMLSRSRMEEIMSEWIFMRWKERCFIHSKSDSCHGHEHTPRGVMPLGEGDDTDTGHGLTISGFYYVSLRRSDGKIDGLYFDTKTSPYQHLKLESKMSGLHGAWQFK